VPFGFKEFEIALANFVSFHESANRARDRKAAIYPRPSQSNRSQT
jgi:hypothetical protein